ncbi:MAG: hypothetical protein VW258_11770 [Thalassolituus sp.]
MAKRLVLSVTSWALVFAVVACAVPGCTTTRTVSVPVPVLPAVPESLLQDYPGDIPRAGPDGVMCFGADDVLLLQDVLNWYITRHRGLASLWLNPGSAVE